MARLTVESPCKERKGGREGGRGWRLGFQSVMNRSRRNMATC